MGRDRVEPTLVYGILDGKAVVYVQLNGCTAPAIIDPEDVPKLQDWGSWSCMLSLRRARTPERQGAQAWLRKSGGKIKTHLPALILGKAPQGMEIAHLNGLRNDCRRCNLEFRPRHSGTKNKVGRYLSPDGQPIKPYPGIHWQAKGQRWLVTLTHDCVKVYGGCYRLHADAVQASMLLREKLGHKHWPACSAEESLAEDLRVGAR